MGEPDFVKEDELDPLDWWKWSGGLRRPAAKGGWRKGRRTTSSNSRNFPVQNKINLGLFSSEY